MAKKKTKTHFDLEFKKKAVLLIQKERVTLSEVASELGLSQQNLSRWRKELSAKGEMDSAEEELDALVENKRLKKQLCELQMENEILKKAASYFASHQ